MRLRTPYVASGSHGIEPAGDSLVKAALNGVAGFNLIDTGEDALEDILRSPHGDPRADIHAAGLSPISPHLKAYGVARGLTISIGNGDTGGAFLALVITFTGIHAAFHHADLAIITLRIVLAAFRRRTAHTAIVDGAIVVVVETVTDLFGGCAASPCARGAEP